jgi:hypothetical protein
MAGIRPSANGRATLVGLRSASVRRAAWKPVHRCEQRLADTFHMTSRSEIVERLTGQVTHSLNCYQQGNALIDLGLCVRNWISNEKRASDD